MLLFLLLTILIWMPPVLAQVATGAINVSVEDSSGALVPGAALTLSNANTGLTRTGRTNERGEFLAPFLPVGEYVIAAEHPGFKKTSVFGLQLRVDQTASIRVVLQPGEVRESVGNSSGP